MCKKLLNECLKDRHERQDILQKLKENGTDNFLFFFFQEQAFKGLRDLMKKNPQLKKHYVHYLDYMCLFWNILGLQKQSRFFNK